MIILLLKVVIVIIVFLDIFIASWILASLYVQ